MMNFAIGLNIFAALFNLGLFIAFGNPISLLMVVTSSFVAVLLQRAK